MVQCMVVLVLCPNRKRKENKVMDSFHDASVTHCVIFLGSFQNNKKNLEYLHVEI